METQERRGGQERPGRAARQEVMALGAVLGAQGPKVRSLGDAEFRMYIVVMLHLGCGQWELKDGDQLRSDQSDDNGWNKETGGVAQWPRI